MDDIKVVPMSREQTLATDAAPWQHRYGVARHIEG